jgi:hypothetical protein
MSGDETRRLQDVATLRTWQRVMGSCVIATTVVALLLSVGLGVSSAAPEHDRLLVCAVTGS